MSKKNRKGKNRWKNTKTAKKTSKTNYSGYGHVEKKPNTGYNNQANTYKRNIDVAWDSGLTIVQKPEIILDSRLLLICNEIQSKFPGLEFSILCKGYPTQDGFYASDDYVIPEQKVTASSVDYEDLYKYQAEGYNVVIHSHHNLGTFFSATDTEHINCHFPCSVLYTKDGFTLATLSFHRDETVFLVETKNVSLDYDENIIIEGIDNIKKGYYYGGYNNGYNYGGGVNNNLNQKLNQNKEARRSLLNSTEPTQQTLLYGDGESAFAKTEELDEEERYVVNIEEGFFGIACYSCTSQGGPNCIRCYGVDVERDMPEGSDTSFHWPEDDEEDVPDGTYCKSKDYTECIDVDGQCEKCPLLSEKFREQFKKESEWA